MGRVARGGGAPRRLRHPGGAARSGGSSGRAAGRGGPPPPGRPGGREALAGEIRFYRAPPRPRDATPRRWPRCASSAPRVLAEGLGPDVPPLPRLAGILVESLRFELIPDALPALDDLAAAGLRLARGQQLGRRTGGRPGRPGRGRALSRPWRPAPWWAPAKPDPAIFAHALDALGRAGLPRRALRGPPGPRLRGRARGRRARGADRPVGCASACALPAHPLPPRTPGSHRLLDL